jgi:hypothetical protein
MTKNNLQWFLCLSLFSAVASAQGVQNSDIAAMFGPTSVKAQGVPGSNITTPGSTGLAASVDYGYQLVRRSAASLWLDIALPNTSPGKLGTSVPGSIDDTANFYVAGVRFMAPINPRVSIYGVTGVGLGAFHYAVVTGETSPTVKSTLTVHGAFDFGGGVDVRLTRHFSIRAEGDVVTGAGLSGIEGRNHIMPLVGLAFHH